MSVLNGGASIKNRLLLFPFFIRVLGGIDLFETQVAIVHISSLRAIEAGRIAVPRLPTRGRPRSSGRIRSAPRASSNKHEDILGVR